MGSCLCLLGMKNNENANPISKLSILQCFLLVFVIDFSFSLCFTTNFDAFLLKSCSKAAPAALGGCGGLDQLMGLSWGCHGVVMGLPWGCHGEIGRAHV